MNLQSLYKQAILAIFLLGPSTSLFSQEPKDKLYRTDVNFASAKWDLQESDKRKLNKLCEEIEGRDNYEITLFGHTDTVGSYEYNLQLSHKRAQTVKAFFVAKGADTSKIVIAGKSFTTPKANNATEAGKATNRRTAVRLTVFYFPVPALSPVEGLAPGATFNLGVLFIFNKTEFQDGVTKQLDEIAEFLNKYEGMEFELLGWTAVTATRDKLSHRRAEAVYNYLVDKGIKPERMTHRGMGGAGCRDKRKFSKCRRVEIAIKKNPYYDSALDLYLESSKKTKGAELSGGKH